MGQGQLKHSNEVMATEQVVQDYLLAKRMASVHHVDEVPANSPKTLMSEDADENFYYEPLPCIHQQIS